MKASQPVSEDDLSRWVTTIVEDAPEGSAGPLSLRMRPLENWSRLMIGEISTLSSRRASEVLAAQMRAAEKARAARRTRAIAAVFVALLWLVAIALAWAFHRAH